MFSKATPVKQGVSGIWIGLTVALLAASAFVRIPMYPMPLTMQIFVVFLLPIVFGPKISFYGVGIYIALGLAGLPIFSTGGGIAYILMPSFGFLIGYLLAVIPAGIIANMLTGIKGVFLSLIVSIIVIYTCGIFYLYININFIQEKSIPILTVLKGFLVFILPDMLKLAGAVFVAPILSKVFKST